MLLTKKRKRSKKKRKSACYIIFKV